MMVGWFGGALILLSAVALGQRTPASVLMSWADGARGGGELASLLDLRGGQSAPFLLPLNLPLAQQMNLANCGASYHILQPGSASESFFAWVLAGGERLTRATYPAHIADSTVRIGRRTTSPDGRWLFLPYDRLALVIERETGETHTLFVAQEPASAGQPGYWSPDSRWLLWPYEVSGGRVLWQRFDAASREVMTIETPGQATFIDDVRYGLWSPDSRHFATIHRYEDPKGAPRADLLLLTPTTIDIRRFSFHALANEMIWSPDSEELLLFASDASDTGARRLLPSLLDVRSGHMHTLVDAGYPAPSLRQPFAYAPTWSPDGQQFALFTSDEPSQSAVITLRILNRDGSAAWSSPLPTRTRTPPDVQFWSMDGRQYALHDRARGVLMRYDLNSGTLVEFGGGMQRIIAVLQDQDALILIEATRPGRSIQRLPWASDTVEPIRRTDGTQTIFSLCEAGA